MARPTAALVRSTLRADKALMRSLSAEARATVVPGARGTLHAEAVSAFNANRRGVHRYVKGNSKRAAEATAARRKALRDAGHAVGARGPLSKSAAKARVTIPKG